MEVYTLQRIPPPFSNLDFGAWEEVSSGRVLQGADSTHSADSTIEAGLPNITGSLGLFTWGSTSGAFSGPKTGNSTGAAWYDENNKASIIFDASRSSSIYGSSSTVQPPAYVVHIWKRVS